MKKAKEYAQGYIDAEDKTKEIKVIYFGFIGEVGELTKQRRVQTKDGMKGIIKELEEKWKSLCRQLEKHYNEPILKEDGFIDLLQIQIPMTKELIY